MCCPLSKTMHSRFKHYDPCFVKFWHNYFQSTGSAVRDLPIKYFLSAAELVDLCDLSLCCCKDLLEKLWPEEKFRCFHCDKKFNSNSMLRAHIKEHKSRNQNRFECVFCSKCTVTKVALTRHMELHTREYQCNICKQPLQSYDVDRHNQTKKHLQRVKSRKEKLRSRRNA